MSRFGRLVRKLAGELSDGRFVLRAPQLLSAVAGRVRSALVGPRHMLPEYFIVGAMKSGTSFLNWLLAQHPQVLACSKKEPNYFNLQYGHGLNWYRTLFPMQAQACRRSLETGLPTVTGESSLYLSHPHAARRIAQDLPNAKIIVLLRNPVQRAISDYHYMVKRGLETATLEEALARDPAHLQGELEKMRADERYQSKAYLDHAYLARSVYLDQLLDYHRHFPRDQVLILPSEFLYSDCRQANHRVQEFLGLQRWTPTYVRPISGGNYPPPPSATVEFLRRYFQPHNERLYLYLGVNFGWDRAPMAAAA